MQRLLDYNPITGMKVTFEYDEITDGFTIGHHQDTTAVIEDNKWALGDLAQHKEDAKGDMFAHYAKVPDIVIMEWKVKYGVDFMDPNHWKKCMSLLNSPDYKYLKRTSYHHDR